MSETKRKNFTGELKAKVALEAIRGIKTVNEIGQEFGPIVLIAKKRLNLAAPPQILLNLIEVNYQSQGLNHRL